MAWSEVLLFGVGILIGVVFTLFFTGYALWKCLAWRTVSATVLRYRISRGEGISYHPVVKFDTIEGKPIVAFVAHGSWRRPWERGEQIAIQYNPRNPRCVDIGSWWGLLMPILSGVGLTAAFIAGAVLWKR